MLEPIAIIAQMLVYLLHALCLQIIGDRSRMHRRVQEAEEECFRACDQAEMPQQFPAGLVVIPDPVLKNIASQKPVFSPGRAVNGRHRRAA